MTKRQHKKKKAANTDIINEQSSSVAVAVVDSAEVKLMSKRRKKIDIPENFIEVYTKYQNKEEGYKSYAQAGVALGVSAATFQRWATGYKKYLVDNYGEQDEEGFSNSLGDALKNMTTEDKETLVQEEKEEEEKTKEEVKEVPVIKDINENDRLHTSLIFDGNSKLEAGMVAGRHEMPVNKYIFDASLEGRQLSDFEWQDSVVNDFLDEELGFTLDTATGNYIPNRDLVLYATGIQCVICSIFKCCNERHVNLTVMHYEHKRDVYHPQVVLSGYPIASEVNKMFPFADTLEAIDYDKYSIELIKDYFNIKIREYDNAGNVTHTREIVASYLNLINDKCYQMIPELMIKPDRFTLDIYKSKIENGVEKDIEQRFHCSNWR